MKKILFLTLLALGLDSKQVFAMTCAKPPQTQMKPVWILTQANAPKGVVLIGHGLNMRPSAMDALGKALGNHGNFDVLRLTLSGHANDFQAYLRVTRKRWLEDFFTQYCVARAQADSFHVPLYFVGFSLSAIVGLDALEQENEIRFERMALLAPPAVVWPASRFVKIMGIFGRDHIVRSFAEPSYRANLEGTSMAAYFSLFDSVDAYEGSDGRRSHIPTLVVMDPQDELVSLPGLRKLVIDFGLEKDWNFFEVTNAGTKLKKSYHHFITDDVALGDSEWVRLVDAVAKHLENITE